MYRKICLRLDCPNLQKEPFFFAAKHISHAMRKPMDTMTQISTFIHTICSVPYDGIKKADQNFQDTRYSL